jgi:hypothetical protein
MLQEIVTTRIPYTWCDMTVAWQVNPSFLIEPQLFLPQSTVQELSEHIIDALAR